MPLSPSFVRVHSANFFPVNILLYRLGGSESITQHRYSPAPNSMQNVHGTMIASSEEDHHIGIALTSKTSPSFVISTQKKNFFPLCT